ncbi:collectin-10-like [Pomacea canaliculata]|uniref:collectin-10-like n=1 Tax=Pomacea canaliculata TaxID=400727 RepID=UPI000D72CEBC|nr:collectin-10-like [Pomacea canaliculata]
MALRPLLVFIFVLLNPTFRGQSAQVFEREEPETRIFHKCKGSNLTLYEPDDEVTVLHVFVFYGRESLASSSVPATGLFEKRLTVDNNGRVTLTNLTSDDLGRYRVEVQAEDKITHNIRLIIKAQCLLKAGYMWYLGTCLKLSTKEVNYVTAKVNCQADGAHLYDIKSPVLDEERVRFAVKQAGLSLSIHIWLGGNDLEVEGDYRWSDGTPLSSSSKLWATGQPDDGDGGQDCIFLYVTYLKFVLYDDGCSFHMHYLCQYDVRRKTDSPVW